MRIAFFVNDIQLEEPKYTTTRLAVEALRRGHEVAVLQPNSFWMDEDDRLFAEVKLPAVGSYELEEYLSAIQSDPVTTVCVDEFDILFLRSDPSEEKGSREWAQEIGLHFGRIAMRSGVLVLNDPDGLQRAMNKLYVQHFPREIRPRTLITRSVDRIVEFLQREERLILKPLQGSRGEGVFLLTNENLGNLKIMASTLKANDYIIAQQYLPDAEQGDVRLFLLNGKPFVYKNKYAFYRKISSDQDVRSNVSAGGQIAAAELSDSMLHIAEAVGPKLIEDGIFFAGLDIMGDKLLEINVFSPGGLGSAEQFEGVNFSEGLIDSLEEKVDFHKRNGQGVANSKLATMQQPLLQ